MGDLPFISGIGSDGHEAIDPQVGEFGDLPYQFFYLVGFHSVLAGCSGGVDLDVNGEGAVGVAFFAQAALQPVEALGKFQTIHSFDAIGQFEGAPGFIRLHVADDMGPVGWVSGAGRGDAAAFPSAGVVDEACRWACTRAGCCELGFYVLELLDEVLAHEAGSGGKRSVNGGDGLVFHDDLEPSGTERYAGSFFRSAQSITHQVDAVGDLLRGWDYAGQFGEVSKPALLRMCHGLYQLHRYRVSAAVYGRSLHRELGKWSQN